MTTWRYTTDPPPKAKLLSRERLTEDLAFEYCKLSDGTKYLEADVYGHKVVVPLGPQMSKKIDRAIDDSLAAINAKREDGNS